MISENNSSLSSTLLVLILLLSPTLALNQSNTSLFEEQLMYDDESTANLDEQLEHFQVLSEHPLELNKATIAELEQSLLFNPTQLNALITHREQHGDLISLYELQAIPHFDLDYIYTLLPYVTLKKSLDDFHLKFRKLISKGDHQIYLRYGQSFPSKSGNLNKNYVGHPSNIYVRYRYTYGNKFYYGVTMEKDAGEAMFKKESKQGFDFYSYHLFWRVNTKIKAIALGDYHVNLGQGLILWTGFGFNKGGTIANVKKEANSLKPFTSISESIFLRGFATHAQIKAIQFTAFVSHKAIDANIVFTDSTMLDLDRNSIQTSGLHRTESELNNKHNLKETLAGFNIQFKKRDKHLGLNTVFLNYSNDLKNANKAYNQFYFQNKQLLNTSLDYHYLIKSFHFFGESAISISKDYVGVAALHGLLFNPDKTVDMALVHRYYSPRFQNNRYSNAFGESSQTNNEHGLYLSLTVKLSKAWTLSSYFDYYRFPWLNYQIDQPGNGQDFMNLLTFKHKKIVETYISYKRETKEANTRIDLGVNESYQISPGSRKYLAAYFPLVDLSSLSTLRPTATLSKQEIENATFISPVLQQKLRWHLSFKANKSWTFQTRLELSFYNDRINPKQSGFMIYQDIKFSKMEIPFSFSVRLALFDIAQYNSRIYAYENDVLNSFSIPALYNAGIRYYLNVHYKINKHLDAWFRFSHSYYSDISSKGSGNDTVNQNRIYDMKMQLRVKF